MKPQTSWITEKNAEWVRHPQPSSAARGERPGVAQWCRVTVLFAPGCSRSLRCARTPAVRSTWTKDMERVNHLFKKLLFLIWKITSCEATTMICYVNVFPVQTWLYYYTCLGKMGLANMTMFFFNFSTCPLKTRFGKASGNILSVLDWLSAQGDGVGEADVHRSNPWQMSFVSPKKVDLVDKSLESC